MKTCTMLSLSQVAKQGEPTVAILLRLGPKPFRRWAKVNRTDGRSTPGSGGRMKMFTEHESRLSIDFDTREHNAKKYIAT
jgi:hypothetical protein